MYFNDIATHLFVQRLLTDFAVYTRINVDLVYRSTLDISQEILNLYVPSMSTPISFWTPINKEIHQQHNLSQEISLHEIIGELLFDVGSVRNQKQHFYQLILLLFYKKTCRFSRIKNAFHSWVDLNQINENIFNYWL